MTLDEIVGRYRQLCAERQSGRLTEEQFVAAVGELRGQDAAGRWWAVDAATGGWLHHDGAGWRPHEASARPRQRATVQSLMDERGMRRPRLSLRQQRFWRTFSVIGGFAAGILWLVYTGVREGRDWTSALLMMALPIGLRLFQRPIDRALAPLQPMREKLPRLVLVALGLAAPYIIAFILYRILRVSQYPYMRWTIFLGVLTAHAILRTPAVPRESTGIPPGGKRATPGPTPLTAVIEVMLRLVAVFGPLLCASAVWADDFLRDPLNARDGLRTPGIAELMSGTAAEGISLLGNAPEVSEALFPSDGGGDSGVDDEEQDGAGGGTRSVSSAPGPAGAPAPSRPPGTSRPRLTRSHPATWATEG